MNKTEAKKLILEHLEQAVLEDAHQVYLDALATDDDETTLRDLVLIAVGK